MRVEFDEEHQKYARDNLFKTIEAELSFLVSSLDSDTKYQLQRIIAKENRFET